MAIGAAGRGRWGGQHPHPVRLQLAGGTIDQAQHRHPGQAFGHIEGEGVGGVAGHQDPIHPLAPQPADHLGGDGANLLGAALAVGHPGRVAQVEAALARPPGQHLAQHRQTADAAIKQAQQAAHGPCLNTLSRPRLIARARRRRWAGSASRGESSWPVTKPSSTRAEGITVRRIT